jgi:hypothetical protein
MAESTDNSISAATLLSTVADINHWTIPHFFIELYTSADDAAKSVTVDLVKWLKHDNKYSSTDQVKLFRIFRTNIFFRKFRTNIDIQLHLLH